MTDDPALTAIRQILKREFPDDTVDVSRSPVRDNIHVVVMSRKFDDMSEKQKLDYVWELIDASELDNEQKFRVKLIVALSPSEVK